jgi:hypothetical protein
MKPYNSSIPPQEEGVMPVSSPAAIDYLANAEAIRPWVDPEERVAVDFQDPSELNAEVLRLIIDQPRPTGM